MNEALSTQPKYATIAARYRSQIETGVLRPGDRLPSFAEVRTQMGVGQSTLERAHEMLEREALIIREPGRGIFVAKRGHKPRTGIIGISGIDAAKGHHPYFSRLLEGVHQTAHRAGVEILLMHEELTLPSDKVDGVLLYSVDPDTALRKLPAKIPCVSLLTLARGISSLTVDDTAGITLAVEHLVKLGHRRIAYLSAWNENVLVQENATAFENTVVQERVTAYTQALKAAGIEPVSAWVRHMPELSHGENHYQIYRAFIDKGYEVMSGWLNDDWAELGCTALLAHNDDTAIGAKRALETSGWDVPEQVSIVGFDDTLSAELCHPPLTTVHVPLRELGARAMEILLDEIEAASGALPVRRMPESVFTPSLQIRASTAGVTSLSPL